MNVFELFAVLTLQKDDYENALNDTENKSKGWAGKVEGFLKSKVVTAWVAVATAIIGVGKKLNQLMLDTMNYADTVGDLAAKYGVTTDAISEMQYIADQNSTSIEGMTSAMTMLLNRAKENGEGFKELGVDVYDANGNLKQMDELFYETIGALNSVESEGERSRLMLETFGRSAMSVGEVVRKSSEELAQMRQEAHDLGVVMSEETIQYASDMNDTFARMKLQGQSALASLVAGAPDAEEKLQNYFDSIMEMLDSYIPAFANFTIRLVLNAAMALVRIAPSLVVEILDAVIDTIFNIDWLQVGVDIAKAILEGMVNVIVSALNLLLGWTGLKIPKVDFGVGSDIGSMSLGEMVGEEYEISENINQKIEVEVTASGDSSVSQDTAEKTAQALAPYIDKILGGK